MKLSAAVTFLSLSLAAATFIPNNQQQLVKKPKKTLRWKSRDLRVNVEELDDIETILQNAKEQERLAKPSKSSSYSFITEAIPSFSSLTSRFSMPKSFPSISNVRRWFSSTKKPARKRKPKAPNQVKEVPKPNKKTPPVTIIDESAKLPLPVPLSSNNDIELESIIEPVNGMAGGISTLPVQPQQATNQKDTIINPNLIDGKEPHPPTGENLDPSLSTAEFKNEGGVQGEFIRADANFSLIKPANCSRWACSVKIIGGVFLASAIVATLSCACASAGVEVWEPIDNLCEFTCDTSTNLCYFVLEAGKSGLSKALESGKAFCELVGESLPNFYHETGKAPDYVREVVCQGSAGEPALICQPKWQLVPTGGTAGSSFWQSTGSNLQSAKDAFSNALQNGWHQIWSGLQKLSTNSRTDKLYCELNPEACGLVVHNGETGLWSRRLRPIPKNLPPQKPPSVIPRRLKISELCRSLGEMLKDKARVCWERLETTKTFCRLNPQAPTCQPPPTRIAN